MSESSRFNILHPGALELMAIENSVWSWVVDLDGMFALLPNEFNWRYDDNSSILGIKSEANLSEGMLEMIEAFKQDLMAQTIACGWRVREACEAAIFSLNNGSISAMSSSSRLAFESSVVSMSRFQDFKNRIVGLNRARSREAWLREWELFDQGNNSANFGRHASNPGNYPFASVAIGTHLEKAKKYLRERGHSEDLAERIQQNYVELSEITHPNAQGLQLYWNMKNAAPLFPGAPSYRNLERLRGLSLDKDTLALLVSLWTLGFSAYCSTEVFYRANGLRIEILSQAGPFGRHIKVWDATRENPLIP